MAYDRPAFEDDAAPGLAARHPPARPHWRGRRRIELGMPQLDACGLSEHWMQKACGELHWRGLAASLGRPPQAWLDQRGQRVYAAFGYLRLQDAELWRAREGAALSVSSTLSPMGRAQAWSRHLLRADGRAMGELEMLSVFVSREDGLSNRSVRRVAMDPVMAAPAPARAHAALAHARAWRAGLAPPAASVAPPGAPPPWHGLPCPRSDFNGAGLLYFPSFTAFADRALWAWGKLGPDDMVQARECLFLGNIELGETVRVSLAGDTRSAQGRALQVLLSSATDERLIAAVRVSVRPLAQGLAPARAAAVAGARRQGPLGPAAWA